MKNTNELVWLSAVGLSAAVVFAGAGRDNVQNTMTPTDLEVITQALEEIHHHDHDRRLPRPATDADFYPRDPAKEELGKFLFYDKILSGNLNISCATCHHPFVGTSDGLSLPVGEGGMGLSTARDLGMNADAVHERVPRNAPHVFNLGAREFAVMFHDGRVEVDPSQPSGFRSPAGALLPHTLDNVLAAQAMFPVTSGAEMAGQAGENPIADMAAAGDLIGIWDELAQRLRGNSEYVELFVNAFDDIHGAGDITYAHAANAIAAFEAGVWRADDAPFDRYLRGNRRALSPSARNGARLFYGYARCADCHAGIFQTNHQFRSIALPQIGPGKGDNLPGQTGGFNDFGREMVTGNPNDRFNFRVPTLRNVVLTGPWGHDGAYNDLEAVIRHHLRPALSLHQYDPSQAILPSRPDLDAIDFLLLDDPDQFHALVASSDLGPMHLHDRHIDDLIEFLHALTDRRSLDMRLDVPPRVPSGLPVFD